jgi:hypothetical protein
MRLLAPLALVAALAGSAGAAPNVHCVATEIVATNEKKGIDPRLESLKSKLATPQFRAWDSFKFIGEAQVDVEEQKPKSSPLEYGKVTLLFKDRLGSGPRQRLHLEVDLDDKNGRRQTSMNLQVDAGDRVLLTGTQFQGGLYILAVGCTAP